MKYLSPPPNVHPDLRFCRDNVDYTFGQFKYKGKIISRDCDWIIKSSNQDLVKQRKKNWCHRKINGDVVRNQCPTACNACLKEDDNSYKFGFFIIEGDIAINRTCAWITRQNAEQRKKNWCNRKFENSIQPIYESCPIACDINCWDNSNFIFGKYKYKNNMGNDVSVTRTCEWITNRLEVADKRRKRWCNREINGVVVKDKCVEACNNCCLDVSTYTFGRYTYKGETVERTCAWITENSERTAVRRKQWCNKDFNGDGEGALVKDFCRVACQEC
jgi:hypothetical protein